MRWLTPLSAARDAARFGRKAAELAKLSGSPGIRVPDGFVLDACAFDAVLDAAVPAAQHPASLVRGAARDRGASRLAAIQARVRDAAMPDGLCAEIAAALAEAGGGRFAVRSSGLHEDAAMASAAGLQETSLGVTGDEAVIDAVRACWASLYAERALAYLARQGAPERLGMAVIVQRMVDARCAGVAFTADPITGDRGVVVIEATTGLGVGVVDGTRTPEVVRFDRVWSRVSEHRASGEGGAMVLDDALVASVVDAAVRIEEASDAPRDVEWAWDGAVLWVLQSRPVVGLPDRAGTVRSLDDRAGWIWSNVNVGEALPGVATPLTWSIASAFSDRGFRRAFAGLGCVLDDGLELVGNFHGRIYLNLTNFVRVARQVPLLSPRMLIELGGGGGLEEVERQVPPGAWWPFVRRLPRTALSMVADNASLPERLRRFEADFVVERERFATLPLRTTSRVAVRALLRETRTLLDRTGELMLACASGYLASVVAMRELLRWSVPAEADRLERELLAGIADLDSAAPGISLAHIAEVARLEPAARALILGREPRSLRVDELPDGPTRRAFAAFLRAYGYRCPREAELSTPRWREDPGTLFAALRAYLVHTDDRILARVEKQLRVRASAEEELADRLPPIGRSGARHLLARTQRFARLRERMRARVTEVLGFFRVLAVASSERLGGAGDAAFLLTVDELDAWLGGELPDPDGLLALRRAEYARDCARPDPPATFVGSPPPFVPREELSGDRFVGVGASPGVVTGVVRVLREPGDGAALCPGEVLVTAVADVGWTPLFLVAAAVVTELGGALSHAALVAREYGVPTVVNVRGATRALRTGDRVRVDGGRGVVERLPCE